MKFVNNLTAKLDKELKYTELPDNHQSFGVFDDAVRNYGLDDSFVR